MSIVVQLFGEPKQKVSRVEVCLDALGERAAAHKRWHIIINLGGGSSPNASTVSFDQVVALADSIIRVASESCGCQSKSSLCLSLLVIGASFNRVWPNFTVTSHMSIRLQSHFVQQCRATWSRESGYADVYPVVERMPWHVEYTTPRVRHFTRHMNGYLSLEHVFMTTERVIYGVRPNHALSV